MSVCGLNKSAAGAHMKSTVETPRELQSCIVFMLNVTFIFDQQTLKTGTKGL